MANSNPFLWWLPTADAAKTTRASDPVPDGPSDPGHLIRRAQQIAVAIFLEECVAFDLTPVQYAALMAIRDNPGIDATRIAGMIAFDRTTVSGVMERLQAKGWVTRAASKDDRRIKVVTMTAKGRKLLTNVEPLVAKAQLRILAPLDAEERTALMSLLGKLVNLNNSASRAPQRTGDGTVAG